MHSEVKFLVHEGDAEERFGFHLSHVASLNIFKVKNESGIVEPAELPKNRLHQLIGYHDLADLRQVQPPHEGAAAIWKDAHQPFCNETIDRLPGRSAAELELIDQKRLIELAPRRKAQADDLRPDEVDRGIR